MLRNVPAGVACLARPRRHTYCIVHPVEELVTWPYLTARETGESIATGHVAPSFLWKEDRFRWIASKLFYRHPCIASVVLFKYGLSYTVVLSSKT